MPLALPGLCRRVEDLTDLGSFSCLVVHNLQPAGARPHPVGSLQSLRDHVQCQLNHTGRTRGMKGCLRPSPSPLPRGEAEAERPTPGCSGGLVYNACSLA